MKPELKHLVIFARRPQLGQVKRRLARDIGAVAALQVYRTLLQRTIRLLGHDARWRTWLAVTPDSARSGPEPCWPAGLPRVAQGAGDLGQRMGRVLNALPPGHAVIVGTDIPDIAANHVQAAFRRLQEADAVFGPAADGGYWLAGFRRFPPAPLPFAGVRWSSPAALADTFANCPPAWRIGLIDELADMDSGDDWRAWRRRVAERTQARKTAPNA